MINLKKELSFIAVVTPIIYFLLAVFNFSLPEQRFACFGWSTIFTELLLYGVYILTLKEWGIKMKNIKPKKCKNCKGTGFVPLGEGIKGIKKCPFCDGTGKIETEKENG